MRQLQSGERSTDVGFGEELARIIVSQESGAGSVDDVGSSSKSVEIIRHGRGGIRAISAIA
jgi:hypothetical protein